MKKRLILILALAFVVGMTFAAYAEVQNVKVSGDLLMRGVARTSYEMNDTNEKVDAILGDVRVRIDADLTDNVSTTVRLLNEREWGAEDSADTDIDLDLAYVTLKEFLYSPLTLVAGRQELRYGNALIIGDVDSNATAATFGGFTTTSGQYNFNDLSLRKAFDAVKAILNYDPLVVDLVYAKIEENDPDTANDVNLMGLNASYTINKNLLTEAYLWSRDRQWGSTGLTTTPGQGERLNTLGARAVYSGITNLTLGLEGAWQFGDHVTSATLYPDDDSTAGAGARASGTKSKVNAYAIQLTSNYVMPKVKYTPAIHASYTRLSGDKDQSRSDNYTGWNSMFEDQASGTIFNRIVGYSNAQLINLGGNLKPMEDLTVNLDWYHIRILNTFNESGTLSARILSGIATDPTTHVRNAERHLADEIDLGLTYDYTEDVQLGLCGGLYIPGEVYDGRNKKNASQVIGSMKVTF